MKTIVDFCKIQIFINIGAFFPFFFVTTPAWCQDLIVYPAKGQSNDQNQF